MTVGKSPSLLPLGIGVVLVLVIVGTLFAPLITAVVAFPALAVVAGLEWSKWRSENALIGGAPVLVYFTGCAAYVIGTIRLADEAPYANDIPEQQWLLYLWAGLSAAAGLLAGALLRSSYRYAIGLDARPRAAGRSFPAWVIVVPFLTGMTITWVNFLTGRIPLLAESINEARRVPGDAILQQWSFAAYPTLEFVIIAAAVLPLRRVARWMRIVLIVLCLGTLVLTGSRSFLVFPIVALAFLFIESIRPRLTLILGVGAGLAILVGLSGQLRSIASGTGANLVSNAERWGYGPFATILSPLQVGPHVFAAVQERIPSEIPFQNGVFFLRDFPKLSAGQEADYWVAEAVLGRDTAATGGLPPTVLGGFFIDWGLPGAVIGATVLFFLLAFLRPGRSPLRRSQPAVIAYGILCAYALTSFYSYVSLNVGIIMMLLWCVFLTLGRRADAWLRHRRRASRGALG